MSDPAFTCHFLDADAFRKAEDARMALAQQRKNDPVWMAANNAQGRGWASLREVVAPCAMWFTPWYFDPANPEGHGDCRTRALAAIKAGTFKKDSYYLSRFYWETWSTVRPPISVLCPNGAEWCVDAVSSNGDGWTVEGDVPNITASPSIMVPGYHGFLRGGVFTANL